MRTLKLVIDKVMEILCVSIMTLMTVLVTWQVFTRYVLNSPSAASEVLARYLFVWLVISAAAYVFGQREHMCIAFLIDKLPIKIKTIVEIIGEIIILIFSGLVMLKGGWSITADQMVQIDATLKIPMGLVYSIIPISGAIIVFYSIYNVIQLSEKLGIKHNLVN